MGGTCESITIGHNMSKLPLTKKAIFLETHRPRFLCEKVLGDADEGCLDETSHPMNLANQQSQRSLTAPKAMNLTSTGNLRSSQTSFVSRSMIGSTTLDAMELQKLRKDLEDDSTAAGNPLCGSARSARSSREENEDCATNDDSTTAGNLFHESVQSIREENDDDFFHQDIEEDPNYAPSSITVGSDAMKTVDGLSLACVSRVATTPEPRAGSQSSAPEFSEKKGGSDYSEVAGTLKSSVSFSSLPVGKPIRRTSSMESMTSKPIRRISSTESMANKPIRRISSKESMTSKPIRRASIDSIASLQNASSTGNRLKKYKAVRRASDASMDAADLETRSSAGLIGRFLVLAACYYSTTKN